jgi:hypothetical protein
VCKTCIVKNTYMLYDDYVIQAPADSTKSQSKMKAHKNSILKPESNQSIIDLLKFRSW